MKTGKLYEKPAHIFPQMPCVGILEKWKVSQVCENVEMMWSGKEKFVEKFVENHVHAFYTIHKRWNWFAQCFPQPLGVSFCDGTEKLRK